MSEQQQQHPMEPSLEIVNKLFSLPLSEEERVAAAYCAGADQELKASCEWLEKGPYGFTVTASAPHMISDLRAARRPKPPSLAEQALTNFECISALALEEYEGCEVYSEYEKMVNVIQSALERLKELEKGNE